MTTSLLENISSIPPLPESVQEVERVYQNLDSTFEDMQKAIEKDPFLTANILRIVNSPLYGVKTKITRLEKAIALLGKSSIRTFVLSSAIDSNFEIDLLPYGITPEQFRAACERQMALAISWLGRKEPESSSILAPSAFLVDIGRLIISKTLIEENKTSAIEEALNSGATITEAEKLVCGTETTDVTATLFENWNLDQEMIDAIRHSDEPEGASEDKRIMAAQLKVIRESVMPNGEITEESISVAKETIEKFSLDLESYENALEKILED
jgi:HD-like signal output (HDOD) protein